MIKQHTYFVKFYVYESIKRFYSITIRGNEYFFILIKYDKLNGCVLGILIGDVPISYKDGYLVFGKIHNSPRLINFRHNIHNK